MLRRIVPLMVGVAAIIAIGVLPALATEVFQGQVLSAGNGKLTIQEAVDKTWTFAVGPDCKITRDGKPARLEDLRTTDSATVTTSNRMTATMIEARSVRASAAFLPVSALAAGQYDGTFISGGNGKITMLDQDGKTERSFTVADNAKITRDGAETPLELLQNGDSIKVTTERRLLRELATVIEARTQK